MVLQYTTFFMGVFLMERKVVLYIATSLDGYVATPDGGVEWLDQFNEQLSNTDYSFDSFMDTVDTALMGKNTYEQVLTFGDWPYPNLETYVFSTSMSDDIEHAKVIKEDPKTFIDELKKNEGKDIWLIGGAKLAKAFLDHDLVDEMMIYIMPILLGEGLSLYQGTMDKVFKLKDMKAYADCAFIHYEKQ